MSYSMDESKYLSDEEQATLARAISKAPLRDRLLIELALHTGARAGELLAITTADLDATEKTVFIRGLKDSYNRTLPLPLKMFRELSELAAANGGKPFGISDSRRKQLWDLYKPCKKKFHSLRHTAAVNLYKKCRDLRLVQVALGHKNVANTMVYMTLVINTEGLRKAML